MNAEWNSGGRRGGRNEIIKRWIKKAAFRTGHTPTDIHFIHIKNVRGCRCVPFFMASDQPAEANALCGVIWARRSRGPNHRGLEGPVSFLAALGGVVVSLDGDRKGETFSPHDLATSSPIIRGKPRDERADSFARTLYGEFQFAAMLTLLCRFNNWMNGNSSVQNVAVDVNENAVNVLRL